MPVTPAVHGLMAEFETADGLIEAAHRTRAAGYTRVDAYTPYPLKEAAEALGFRRTAVPTVMFVGGVVGCVGGFLMQYWSAVVDYPINVGGRPLNSWPAFIPVTFELTILTSALVGLFVGFHGALAVAAVALTRPVELPPLPTTPPVEIVQAAPTDPAPTRHRASPCRDRSSLACASAGREPPRPPGPVELTGRQHDARFSGTHIARWHLSLAPPSPRRRHANSREPPERGPRVPFLTGRRDRPPACPAARSGRE